MSARTSELFADPRHRRVDRVPPGLTFAGQLLEPGVEVDGHLTALIVFADLETDFPGMVLKFFHDPSMAAPCCGHQS